MKPNNSGGAASDNDFMAAYVTFHNATLRSAVRMAFRVDDLALEAPDWMRGVHFDITAKVPSGSATLDERRLPFIMSQRLAPVARL